MVRKLLLLSMGLVISVMCANSQEIVKLWGETIPSDSGIKVSEEWGRDGSWVTNVTVPELHIYKPTKNINGKALVICPGGGYAGLAIDHEGKKFAEWLNERGVLAVVLKYRMPNKHSNIPLEDAHEAMRYVRKNADELEVKINKIGVAGFSAGGHLASTVSTHYSVEGISTRPDFSILFYPVVTMQEGTHGGSRDNLLGDSPSKSALHKFSNEEQVTVNTPPTLLLLSDDDTAVPPINSTRYYDALKMNEIPATMYIFPVGGHGWGFNDDFKYADEMKTLLGKWIDEL